MPRKKIPPEPRKCSGLDCNVILPAERHANKKYHDVACQKRSENRRRRGASASERARAVKAGRCSGCRLERARLTAFWWDREDAAVEDMERVYLLCASCLKMAHSFRLGMEKSIQKWEWRAETPAEVHHRAADAYPGLSVAPYDDEYLGFVDRQPNIINRTNLNFAAARFMPSQLYCRLCDKFLCFVSPDGRVMTGEAFLDERAVPCPRCVVAGKHALTKVGEALPLPLFPDTPRPLAKV